MTDPAFRAPAGRAEGLWRRLLGEELRARRRARGETLESVARRAHLSVPYLSEIERGIKEPSSEVIAAIAAALASTLLELTEAVADRLREECAVVVAAPRRSDFSLAA